MGERQRQGQEASCFAVTYFAKFVQGIRMAIAEFSGIMEY
jgi:hypothetical protein